jgi:inorganic triphosphatase YgiF
VEREAKLEAPPGLALHDLIEGLRALDGVEVGDPTTKELDARYWDTDSLRLARSGSTLRHRTTDGDAGTWTVKFPAPEDRAGGVMVRSEIDLEGAPDAPPERVRRAVAGLARGAELVPVGRLHTTRHHVVLRRDGEPVAELDDDEVVVTETGEPGRFREIEAELAADADPRLLDELVEALRRAGAGPADPTPKLVRALGDKAAAPPDLVVPSHVGRDSSLADVLSEALAEEVLALQQAHHPVVLDGGPQAVRALRRRVRRLRTLLWFGDHVVEGDALRRARADLRWSGALLQAVGEVDTLVLRLQKAARRLGDPLDVAAAGELARLLEPDRAERLELVGAELGSERHGDVLDALVAVAADPPWSRRANHKASKELPKLVRLPWARLDEAAAAVGSADDLAGLREVRVHAGRVRFGSEVAEGVVGPGAQRLAAALADVRRSLGEVADTAASVAWLRDAASRTTPHQAFVAGVLLAAEEAAHRRALRRWRDAWDRADRHRATGWLG